MAILKAKKLVEKEGYRITEIEKVPGNIRVKVTLENGEFISLPVSSNLIEVGDYVITQSPGDRYHCPAQVVKDQYDVYPDTLYGALKA